MIMIMIKTKKPAMAQAHCQVSSATGGDREESGDSGDIGVEAVWDWDWKRQKNAEFLKKKLQTLTFWLSRFSLAVFNYYFSIYHQL